MLSEKLVGSIMFLELVVLTRRKMTFTAFFKLIIYYANYSVPYVVIEIARSDSEVCIVIKPTHFSTHCLFINWEILTFSVNHKFFS